MSENLSVEVINRIAQLGQAEAAQPVPQQLSGSQIPFIIHAGKLIQMPELVFNDHAERPERIRANVSVLDPESFIEYFKLYGDKVKSRVFADESKISVTGVIDYHDPTDKSPRWCQHRVVLALRTSDQWKTWIGADNKQMTQAAFGEFLEQNAIDITKPAPADMLEVARDIQAHTEVEFGSGTRAQDGQVRFKYSETTNSTVGGGQVAVPEQFVITIPAFVGGVPVAMQALFRFRVRQGALTMWYTLIRPEDVIRTAFLTARDQIATSLEITIINGDPAPVSLLIASR